MGSTFDFEISDNELMLALEEEDLMALFDMMDEEMQPVEDELFVSDNDENGFIMPNLHLHEIDVEDEVELNNRDDESFVSDNDENGFIMPNLHLHEDDVMYDGDVDTDTDSDNEEFMYQQNRPATLPLFMGNIPEYPPLPPIPQTPPSILHPTQPDPAQVLSWQIYNLSRQIDEYIDEYIGELQGFQLYYANSYHPVVVVLVVFVVVDMCRSLRKQG